MNRSANSQPNSRKTWRNVLEESSPLLLPVAHDALTARLIEQAGYPAYQIGGFALVGSRFAYPDIDLAQFGENSAVMRDTIAASSLPVLVDADDAYGDAKNVTRVVQGYEAMGASAIFLEDQQAPKRCGHMLGKKVVPAEVHAGKIRAAVAARHDPETFIMARTDALAPLGLDEALRRAELYLKAGADGVYIEAVETEDQLEKVGRALRGVPLATSILEGGGRTPWIDPKDLYALGYTMLLYPSTVIFRVTRAIQKAVADLKAGRPMRSEESVTFGEYEEILGLQQWAALEDEFVGRHELLSVPAAKAS
ncbi:MAG TPA: isocitrate lyase/PEP mutase family protein [Candidatus Eisenbacteria bacterium]|jgi:2-methylisocitrate lyase-like PEP mutase family enzyme|nr:isocitrate lyase/PEP mutase family protein [Candidatus Eisenbacteria bacterium]